LEEQKCKVCNATYCCFKQIAGQAILFWGTMPVAQLVEALRYKPEGRGIDSQWCHWNFSLT
jgi:hypothetical protein